MDERGAELDGWQVDYITSGQGWHDSTRTQAGVFAIPNVPEGPRGNGRLLVRSPADDALFPVMVRDADAGTLNELLVSDAARATGALRLELVDAAAETVSEAEVRLWQESSGLGALLARASAGSYEATGLPNGRYRVVARAMEFGSLDLGWLEVRAGELHDLGVIAFPAACELSWNVTDSEELVATDFVWTILRSAAGTKTMVALGSFSDLKPGKLPAGDYELHLSRPGFLAPALRFCAGAGEALELDVDFAAYQPVDLHYSNADPDRLDVRIENRDDGSTVFEYQLERVVSGRVHLPLGSYTIEVASKDGRRGASDFDVQGPGPAPGPLNVQTRLSD